MGHDHAHVVDILIYNFYMGSPEQISFIHLHMHEAGKTEFEK